MDRHMNKITACVVGIIITLAIGCGNNNDKDNNKNCPDVKVDQRSDNNDALDKSILTITSKADQLIFKDVLVFQTKSISDMDNDSTMCSISGWNREGKNIFSFITKIPAPTTLNRGESLSFPTTCQPLTGAVVETDYGTCKYYFK